MIHPRYLADFVQLIRKGLVGINQVSLSRRDGGHKFEQLMMYLQSPDFRNRMAYVIDSVKKLEALQQREQKAHDKIWNEQDLLYKSMSASNSDIDTEIKAIIMGH